MTLKGQLTGIVLICALRTSGAMAGPPMGSPTLENREILLGFDCRYGRLVTFRDKVRSFDAVQENNPLALWSVERTDGAAVTADRARTFSWHALENARSGLRLTWSGFDLPSAPAFQVNVEVALDGDRAASRWRLCLENLGGTAIRSVHFPRLGTLRAQVGETLSAPLWMGEQTRNARPLLNPPGGRGDRWEWEYPGLLSMQCLSWYRESGAGLLLATNDRDALGKRFAVFGDGKNGLAMEVVHLPSGMRPDSHRYEVPYDVLITAHDGGWHGAAREYRRWAREQSWVKQSRLRTSATTDWLRQTGLWVWNRGRSEEVLSPARILQEHAGLPVSVFWHWWHGCAYDAGFPEYLPPREGTEAFKAAVASAHGQSIHTLVYMNQRLWGMTTASWTAEDAQRYAVKRPDGKVTPEVYNRFMRVPCASMCMGTAFWRDKYAGLATAAIAGLGVDGIYMDQACSSLACYDPDHGHPPGGGAYWMEGFQRLASDIRRRCASTGPVTLAGEGCGEAWLPHLDAMLSLQVSMERYAAPGEWEPIPFFHAVYHDCAIFYGNYSSLTRPPYDALWPREHAPKQPLALLDRKFAAQFRLEQARAFAWGQQPSLANFVPGLLDERREEIEFVLQLARLRQHLLPYLQEGTLLPPLQLNVPSITIPMSRLSIYAGQKEAVQEFVKTVPQVISSVWQAPDGRVAVVLVNIGDAPTRLTVGMSARAYPMALVGSFGILDRKGQGTTTEYQGGTFQTEVHLPPATAKVVLCPGSG